MCTYVYIHIYIYIDERERERLRFCFIVSDLKENAGLDEDELEENAVRDHLRIHSLRSGMTINGPSVKTRQDSDIVFYLNI
jgi:hypothetical protein